MPPARVQDLVVLCLRAYGKNWAGHFDTHDHYTLVEATSRWTLAFNDDTSALVAAFRGTKLCDLTDVVANVTVLVHGTLSNNPVFEQEWGDLLRALRAARTDPDMPVLLTGHSNGAVFAATAYDRALSHLPGVPESVAAIGFNSATSPASRRASCAKNVLHYVVEGDPVSLWHRGLCGSSVMLPARRGESCMQRHNLRNMLRRRLNVPPKFRRFVGRI